jgi:DNA-binding MarR family transcriptional regulator
MIASGASIVAIHPASEIDSSVAAFRGFNRFYTRLIGVLDERLIESGFSLTEARVLFELGLRAERSAGEIASELSIDPGYLSRILRKLEDGGLLDRSAAPTDARQAILRLTRKGKSALADLDRRSSAQAAGILDKLTLAQRVTLVRSMGEIKSVLDDRPERQAPFILRSHRPGDMGWVIQRHGLLYAQEYGWDGPSKPWSRRSRQTSLSASMRNGKIAGLQNVMANPSVASFSSSIPTNTVPPNCVCSSWNPAREAWV